jgi:His/Glu/Gln/Arg/opine family amino acid ABC transporter permease subunit
MSGFDNLIKTFFDVGDMMQVFPTLIGVGLRNTLVLAASAMLFAVICGLLLSLLLVSRNVAIRAPAFMYVDIFRGLPAILTIYLVGQGLPIAGIAPFGRSPYPYAVVAIGMIQAAYLGEIFRSGIQSLDRSQMLAARSVGMTHHQAMWLIIVPQAIRNVLPATMNQFIIIVKETSLVYLLGLFTNQRELFSIAQDHAANTGNLSALVAAGIIYCAITVPLTHLVNYVDKRLCEGPKPIQAMSAEA